MRKILFMLVMALMSLGAQAQSVTKPGEPYSAYCEIMGYNFWGVGKVKVQLDMGKYTNSKGFDSLYDSEGKKMKFNTMMAVLNFMGERGWKCIGTYYVTRGSTHVVHYLMEKQVSSSDEITEGLTLREDIEPIVEERKSRRGNGDDIYF